jgi:Uma2 family endonuclease
MEEDFDKKYEFVDGKWQAREMGSLRHSGVGTRLIARLCTYVEANELGAVYGADTTFVIGSNDRLPDVSFLSAARIPVDGETDKKWFLAPDLAIEVISPNDVWEQVNRKVREYFAAGVRQVWLISLEQQTVHVYDSPTRVAILTEEQDLANDELLPGFRCRIGDLFKQPARS